MYELTHGMAGERHGHGMLCVNRPLEATDSCPTLPYYRDLGKYNQLLSSCDLLLVYPKHSRPPETSNKFAQQNDGVTSVKFFGCMSLAKTRGMQKGQFPHLR
jgi:hypothetical protein